jgi:anti-sigma factor RsiW
MGDLSCERFVDLMGDYVEGVLPPEERQTMDQHLLSCGRCSELLADYKRIPAVVRRATDIAMPVAAQARLRRLLSRAWRSRS